MKKRVLAAILFFLLLVSLTACTNPELNDEAKQAYEQVLDQYREVAELSYEDYQTRKDEFPYVCEMAMIYYHLKTGNLFYGYYDLNGDGLYELLIGSDHECEEIMDVTEVDIFAYNDGQIYSVLDERFKRLEDDQKYSYMMGPGVYKKGLGGYGNMVYVSQDTEEGKDIFLFELDRGGNELILKKHYCFIFETRRGYIGNIRIPEAFCPYGRPWEYFDERDIPYEVLIERIEELK